MISTIKDFRELLIVNLTYFEEYHLEINKFIMGE